MPDWARVLAVPHQAGYRGWLVLDHLDSPGANGLAADLRHLRALMAVSRGDN